jgi:hypothetical protein
MENKHLQVYSKTNNSSDYQLQSYNNNPDIHIAKSAAYVIGTLHDEVVSGAIRESELTAMKIELAKKNMKLRIMEIEKDSIKQHGSRYDPVSDRDIKTLKLDSKMKKYENKLKTIEIQISSLESRRKEYKEYLDKIKNDENVEDSDDD